MGRFSKQTSKFLIFPYCYNYSNFILIEILANRNPFSIFLCDEAKLEEKLFKLQISIFAQTFFSCSLNIYFKIFMLNKQSNKMFFIGQFLWVLGVMKVVSYAKIWGFCSDRMQISVKYLFVGIFVILLRHFRIHSIMYLGYQLNTPQFHNSFETFLWMS